MSSPKSESQRQSTPDALAMASADRDAQTERVIRNYAYGSAAVGLIPIPVVDLVALTGVQLKLIKRLSVLYGVPFSADRSRNIIASLAGASVPLGLTRGVCSFLKAVPVIGTTVIAVSMSALSAGSTYALGKVFVRHFESGGTFLTFDMARHKDYYDEQVRNAKPVAE
jgi:uncharacterized protein (DUF697 family)